MADPLAFNATALQESLTAVAADVDASWVLVCLVLVFSMQVGFTLLEAGSITFNLRSILMKNVMDSCLCTAAWWFVGHGFARGRFYNGFGAADIPFRINGSELGWLWDLSFGCTATTITSGAVAERTKFLAFALATLWIGGVVYPFVVHWMWSSEGFMSPFNPAASVAALDFAGCGAVHMVGGLSGLVGAWMVGPRPGAFIKQTHIYTKKEQFVFDRLKTTQLLWQAMGTFVLWIGWYGFNCGSLGGIVGKANSVILVAANTTIAAFAGGLVGCIASYLHQRVFMIETVLMGILAGLVSITASAPWVHPAMAPAIALVGFLVFYASNLAMPRLGIDDPVAAFPVHACCGAWGLLGVGLFQAPELSLVPRSWGLQLLHQCVAIVVIGTWTTLNAFVAFYFAKLVLRGIRTVHAEDEYMIVEEEYPRVGPTGRVTLLFTDIQSSTAMWEANEDCMAESLLLHDAVMRSNLKEFHGFEVKTEGDAFMCAFASCEECMKYCIAVQRQLLEVKWPKELYANYAARVQDDSQGRIIWKGLRVRMGFHTGYPTPKENPVTSRTDYIGKDVNYAARVASSGCGGQILLSANSMLDLLPHCSQGVAFGPEPPFGMALDQLYEFDGLQCWARYLGQFELKGISQEEGEHLFQVLPFGLETRQFGSLRLGEEEAEGRAVLAPRAPSVLSALSKRSLLPMLEMASDVHPGRPPRNRLDAVDVEDLCDSPQSSRWALSPSNGPDRMV